jgi:hypothetical protein
VLIRKWSIRYRFPQIMGAQFVGGASGRVR